MQSLRRLDDNIIPALNGLTRRDASSKGAPDACAEFQRTLEGLHEKRLALITSCLALSEKRLVSSSDTATDPQLKRKLNMDHALIKRELGVEEIIQDRNKDVLMKRCRGYL